jgi:broad specificity phosphatase PhoE
LPSTALPSTALPSTALGTGAAAGPAPQWSPPTGVATRLVLVRHGATAHSLERRLSGRNDLPLTPRGVGQAAALAARLASTPDVAAIISSPLRRTQETAQHISQALGLEVRIEEGFQEVDFGAWEGQSFGEVAASAPEAMAAWAKDPRIAPPGGESFADLAARLRPARDKILADYAGRTVIVVSHVTPIKMLLVDAFGAPIESLYRVFLDTASVSIVDYPDGRLSSVRLINGTSHLTEDLR